MIFDLLLFVECSVWRNVLFIGGCFLILMALYWGFDVSDL